MFHASKVHSKYGAPMGRDYQDGAPVGRMSLVRVRINSGGYDDGGAYWGIGQPLYCATDSSDETEIRVFVRAPDRQTAKSLVRARCPGAKFFK